MRLASHIGYTSLQSALLVGFKTDMEEGLQHVTFSTQALCEFAKTSSTALQMLKQQSFECIVIDIDHFDTFAPLFIQDVRNQVGSRDPIHIVTTSKHRFSGLVDQLHKAGADAFFQKPCDTWDTLCSLAEPKEIDWFDAVTAMSAE